MSDSESKLFDSTHSPGEKGGASSANRAAESVEDAVSESADSITLPRDVSPDDATIISKDAPLPRQYAHTGLPPTELGRILQGTRLGHYHLESFVGGGGMGAVFRAHDTMLNRTVAVKVLSSEEARDEETQRRFRFEAQSAARLDHENIARVYNVGEDEGIHYIVFEYIEGINIRDLVARDGPVALENAIDYTLQVAEALAHASRRAVVHRDIKPSNILITPENRAKLVDMGLARLHQVERSEHDLTESGVTLGTFDYISPEQARDPRSADVRSDMYSLGCTLYFMLTGEPPFPRGTMLQKLLQHQGDSAPDARDLRPDLPIQVSRIIQKLLAKSPDKRYQKPGELIAALLAASGELGLPAASHAAVFVTPGLPAETPLRRTLPWLIPLVLFIIIALLLHQQWNNEGAGFQPPKFSSTMRDVKPMSVKRAEESAAQRAGTPPASDEGPPRTSPLPSQTDADRDDKSGATSDKTSAERERDGSSSSDASEKKTETPSTEERPAEGENIEGPSNDREELSSPDASAAVADTAVADNGNETKEKPGVLDEQHDPTSRQDGANSNGLNYSESTVVASQSKALPSSESRSTPRPVDALVVSRAKVEGAFSSLREAVEAAESGDVIELQFSGSMVEDPLSIKDMRLTIRAGEGYQPQIIIRSRAGGMPRERSGITVVGGQLQLVNLDLMAVVPRDDDTTRWSLITARGADAIQLRNCRLTVESKSSGNSGFVSTQSFVYVTKQPSYQSQLFEKEAPAGPVDISVTDCIARGDATFLETDARQRLKLVWDNGLLVTDRRLLAVRSTSTTRERAVERDSRERTSVDSLEVNLRFLTAITAEGLVLVTEPPSRPPTVSLKLKCSDSIIKTHPSAPLIEFRNAEGPSIDQFCYDGDRNYYEGVTTFWRSGDGRQPSTNMDFAAWQKYWDLRAEGSENRPHQESVRWRQEPPDDRPTYSRTVADYQLDLGTAEDNPALRGASDGREVGFRGGTLPTSESSALNEESDEHL